MGVIRIALAISVLLAHASETLSLLIGGSLAVQAFFIISGFYMALVLTEKYDTRTLSGARIFWKARFLRLFPTYWLVAAIALAWLAFSYREYFTNVAQMGRDAIPAMLANLTLVGQDALLWLHRDGSGLHFSAAQLLVSPMQPHQLLLIPQAWSISVEVAFYLVAPVINRLSSRVLFVLLGLSLCGRAAAYAAGLDYDPWTYRFAPFELASFIAGMLAYRLRAVVVVKGTVQTLVWLVVLATMAAFPFFPAAKFGGFVLRDNLFLLLLAASIPVIFAMSRDWKIDRFVGELSYPLYLSHLLMIWVLSRYFTSSSDLFIPALIVATLIASLMIHVFFERRIERSAGRSTAYRDCQVEADLNATNVSREFGAHPGLLKVPIGDS